MGGGSMKDAQNIADRFIALLLKGLEFIFGGEDNETK